MEESLKKTKPEDYDTTINVIGGLRDSGIIYKAFDVFFRDNDSSNDLTSLQNEFHLRTEKSTKRIFRALQEGFLHFYNQDHQDLIRSIFQSKMPSREKDLVLFWQFSLNNRLFREISTNVFLKIYFSGRTTISKEDITGYLKEFLNQSKKLKLNWSEITIQTLSTKYLNFMTKLNVLEGVRSKSFKYVKPTAELLVIFLYFAQLFEPYNNNILTNKMLPLSFVLPEDLSARLKKLSMKGFFNMDVSGVTLNIELTKSYQGICDAIYN